MIVKSYQVQSNLPVIIKNNFFLLYGENEGLKKDIKELIKTSIDTKKKETEILSLFEEDIVNNEENFYNSIFSGSLFSVKKIIIINNAKEKIFKHIENIFDKCPENTFFIIFSGILDKKSKLRNFFEKNTRAICIACYLDNHKDLEIIAKNELKKNNINISMESINLLIDKANNDRNNIKNEIDKVTAFALNKKNIEIDDIKSLINFSGEYKSENLINECLCGNKNQLKKNLSEFYNNTLNYIYFLRILNNKIQRLLNMKEKEHEYSNIESLLNAFKPPIFWKEKPLIKTQLNIWKHYDLKKIINEINDTELLCKKNPNVSKTIFFDFFLKICNKANNFS